MSTTTLTRTGVAWRLTAVACMAAALAYGTYSNSDDNFPVGPLAQFATSPDLNGGIRSAYVVGVDETGAEFRVPLNATETGIGRAEVEGQLGRFQTEPGLLQVIADGYHRLNPDRPRLVGLTLLRDRTQLVDGVATGDPVTTVLAEWTVR